MELLCWPGEVKWTLPSIDISSLHAMAFAKFSKAELKITSTKRSWISRNGLTGNELPCLITADEEKIQDLDHILQYLRLKYYSPDTWMSNEEKERSQPIHAVIEDKLLPAVLSSIWLDSSNYTEVTRGLYARSCQYPLNFSIPQKIHEKQKEFIQLLKRIDVEQMNDVVNQLHGDASLILNELSEFLDEKNYLFGDKPCSVDAFLFSCLAPLLKIPLENNKLQSHLKGCSNLCHFVDRIIKDYFKEETKKQDSDKEVSLEENEESYDWVFPVGIASVAMASYAFNAGLLQTTRV